MATNENIQKIKAALKARGLWSYVNSLKITPRYFPGQERALYLAYGYLRGLAYRSIEPTARPIFDVYGHSQVEFLKGLAALIEVHLHPPMEKSLVDKIKNLVVPETPPKPLTAEDIKAWMALPEPEAHKAKRERKETRAREIRQARRAEYAAQGFKAKVA